MAVGQSSLSTKAHHVRNSMMNSIALCNPPELAEAEHRLCARLAVAMEKHVHVIGKRFS